MKSKNRNDSGKQQQQLPQQPVANNNNNMPFIIHCQIGKEIKHICSNCRGADPRDGEWGENSVEVFAAAARGGCFDLHCMLAPLL
jgi:hypothetical protein